MHLTKELAEYDGPRKGPGLKEDVELNWAKEKLVHPVSVCGKISVEDRERLGCIELGGEYNLGV